MASKYNHSTELSDQLAAGETVTEDRKSQRARNTKIVFMIATSISVAILTYIITSVWMNTAQMWGITLSVFLAVALLILQFIVDLDGRLMDLEKQQARHSNETRLCVEEAFVKMNKATELFRAVEESTPQTGAAMKVLRQAIQIAPKPLLFSGFALAQIRRTAQFLEELRQGAAVTYDGEDRDWMLDLTLQSQATIDATSFSTVDAGGGNSFDGGLWTSDLGQRYLEFQRLAIEKRGVQIRRVFILDNHGQASDEAFQRIYRQQQEMGIHTRVLERSTIRDEFKPFLYDFIVFDGLISYEVTPASSLENNAKPTIVKTQLILKSEQVTERSGRFERFWESAQEI